MINWNGTLHEPTEALASNRGFLYGDAVFETLKVVEGKILFWEDHYFRLMASMRMLRMTIPMNFTLEYLEQEVLQLLETTHLKSSARVRITVYREDGGYYTPQTRTIGFLITAEPLPFQSYQFLSNPYEVELYKDFYLPKHLLNTLKTTNKMVSVLAGIYASENGYQSCLLLNESKNVAEGISGNLFLLTGNRLITPPLTEGCLQGIMRKQILKLAPKIDHLEVVEQEISPFDLQKADEMFLTNVIVGIQPVTQYRKKTYSTTVATQLIALLNAQLV